MRGQAIALLPLLSFLSFGTAFAQIPVTPGAVRVEGVAALVGGHAPGPGVDVVLLSDVELRARMHLGGRAGAPISRAPVAPALLGATLAELIGEILLAREAERVRVATPDDEAVAEQRARLTQLSGGPERLRALTVAVGTTPDEIDAMARRRAWVDVFLNANLEGTTQISDAEVDRVYESGAHPFGDRPVDEVRDDLRAWLARQALDRAVRRWVEVLRSRTVVWVLAPYELAEPVPEG